jgi:hypothetical protein
MASEHPPKLPLVSDVPSLSQSEQEHVLALLFEPAPALFSVCIPVVSSGPYQSYDLLIQAVETRLYELAKSGTADDLSTLAEILSSHPRLGEKKVDSALSRMEQAAMNAAAAQDADKVQEAETLKGLNEEYEKTFPGLRYV